MTKATTVTITLDDCIATIEASARDWKPGEPCHIIVTLDNPHLESTVADKVFQADMVNTAMAGRVEYLRYGVQRKINDGTGGKDVTDEAKHEAAAAKIERMTAGDIGRASGPADPLKRLRKYIRAILKAESSVIALAKKHGVKNDADFGDMVFDKLADDMRDTVLAEAERRFESDQNALDIDVAIDI